MFIDCFLYYFSSIFIIKAIRKNFVFVLDLYFDLFFGCIIISFIFYIFVLYDL